MATLHENLHDCREYAQRHGGKRRRCSLCGHTWSVHKRKRGRKRRRVSHSLPKMVLLDREPTGRLSQRHRCSRYALYRRVRQACEQLVQHPLDAQLLLDEALVLVADGLWFKFQGHRWVLYNMALRPVVSERAYFLDPVLLEGREYGRCWRQALATALAPEQRRRVCAFVTDGFRGAKAIAAANGWVLQRCHWHVLATLRSMLGARNKKIKGRKIRQSIYQLVCEALRTSDETRAREICRELEGLAHHRYCHVRLRYIVCGFVKEIDDFRAYIRYPELCLPNTIGALESMHSQLRDVVSRTRTPQAVLLRIRSFLRFHPSIICRTAKNPQK